MFQGESRIQRIVLRVLGKVWAQIVWRATNCGGQIPHQREMQHFQRSDEVDLRSPTTDALLLLPGHAAFGDIALEGESGVQIRTCNAVFKLGRFAKKLKQIASRVYRLVRAHDCFGGFALRPNCFAMSRAALRASATIVRVGFGLPTVGNTDDPTMNRLRWSCARNSASTTEDFAWFPIRQVPMMCPAPS